MQDLINVLSTNKKSNSQAEKLPKWIKLVCAIVSLYIEASTSTSKSCKVNLLNMHSTWTRDLKYFWHV